MKQDIRECMHSKHKAGNIVKHDGPATHAMVIVCNECSTREVIEVCNAWANYVKSSYPTVFCPNCGRVFEDWHDAIKKVFELA